MLLKIATMSVQVYIPLNMIESFRYLPESIYNFSAVQNSLDGDLSRPASSATAFTIDFQNAFENSHYVSASLHESSNAHC